MVTIQPYLLRPNVVAVDPGGLDQWVSLTLGVQLDVIHASLVNDLAQGVQTYAEQQWGQSITYTYATLDGICGAGLKLASSLALNNPNSKHIYILVNDTFLNILY